ncbi:platelet glycoprotein V [Drosophila nasuta]|uniref:platelet glycoprotein V n=1 Tax=Drosophila nasuta TaxID=42062 RepID=UPI00295E348B|nr:platelet glycoprotein V [Drosophila nasuta]
MLARGFTVAQLLIWTLFVVSNVEGRTEEDADWETTSEIYLETTTEQQQEDSKRSVLVNIESLHDNCKIDRLNIGGICRCRHFKYDLPGETAFFELQQQSGKNYESDEKEHIESLIMENSTFVNFPLHLFYELPKLSELDMRQCGVRHVTWECFVSANKLRILLLSDNEIVELGDSVFNYATELEYLFLNNNQLEVFHPDAFKGLRQLRHLDLSANRLDSLPDLLFEELVSLQELHLAENQLRYISDDLLEHNTRLRTIILHTNHLRSLEEFAFSSATNLLHLDVSNNQELKVLLLSINTGYLMARNCSLNRVNIFGAVTNVDLENNQLQELYFSISEALQHLVLRNNSLQQLAALSHVPRLRHLNVADNPQLGVLPADWQTPQLERLDLSNTGLLEVPLAALRGMPQLRNLNVSANKISDIDPQHFEQLNLLTHFYIHANYWNCFNLRLVMDLLIKPRGISYTVDTYDPEYPGEYFDGIACMYRLSESEQPTPQLEPEFTSTQRSAELVEESEVEKLRREFKAVVQHFEERIDMVNLQLQTLNDKMQSLERLNSSMWNQISITV